MSSSIWYTLNESDIQDVAETNLGRSLKPDEVAKVIRTAEQFIPYAEVILNAIEANGIR